MLLRLAYLIEALIWLCGFMDSILLEEVALME